jgi:hypothetical protein
MKVLPNLTITRQNQFKVRVVYKSGYFHDFWCSSFSINGDQYVWNAVDDNNRPVYIGVDDIAAVYQVSTRRAFKVTWG